MSDTITLQMLQVLVIQLNRRSGASQHNCYIITDRSPHFDTHYQLCRFAAGSTGETLVLTDVSPILPKDALHMWIHAYMDGIDAGYALGRDVGRSEGYSLATDKL